MTATMHELDLTRLKHRRDPEPDKSLCVCQTDLPPQVMTDKQVFSAWVLIACICAMSVLLAFVMWGEIRFRAGWNEGCQHAIENLSMGRDVELR